MKSTRTPVSAILCLLVAAIGPVSIRSLAQPLDALEEVPVPSTIQSFPVEPNPRGMAFDGTNIWVASVSSNYVTKLRASDGARVATIYLGEPTAEAAFDGTYVWFSMYLGDEVKRVR